MKFVCRYATTDETEKWFNDYVLSLIKPENIMDATLFYIKNRLTNYSAPKEDAPLIMTGVTDDGKEFSIHVFCATAGYSGSGPLLSYKLLKKAGFDVTFDQIVNERKDFNYLRFTK